MAQVNNNIWKIVTTPDKADALKNKYNVISQRLFAGKLTSHIYAKSQPSEQFQPVPPDLEDAYFTMLMQSNEGNTQPVGERT